MTDIVDLFNACLYIQDNLDADLSLLFLAQTVGLSRFRFHRVFKAWRGETLHDFVTRMRMERAAFELRYPIPRSSRRSIKAIAFASGYKSLSSFSHAFSSYSHLSPRAFRNQALREKPGATETVRASETPSLFGHYSIRIGHQPAREIAVIDPAVLSREDVRLATLARLASTSPLDGERYAVELLPNILARAAAGAGDGAVSRTARLGCLGVALSGDSGAMQHPLADRGHPAPTRSTLRLSSGRYAVLEGHGSVVNLYRAWRRGFDAWLAVTGECPKPDRLYVRFPPVAAEAANAPIALFIPLEDEPLPSPRSARRAAGDRAFRTTPLTTG